MSQRQPTNRAGQACTLCAGLTALLLPVTSAAASPTVPKAGVEEVPACAGEQITAIEVNSREPIVLSARKSAWNRALALSGLRETPTRPRVVLAYLLLREGQPCTEAARRESERVLRRQPFFNSAKIRVIPEGAGRVRLQVDVVDEIPLIVTTTTRRGTPASLTVGSRNLSGLGLLTSIGVTHSVAYGTGMDARVVQYGLFGRPDFVALDLRRVRYGDRVTAELVEPFLTSLQRRAWHVGAGGVSGFDFIGSPTGRRTALFSHRDFWDAGWVTRLGQPASRRTVGLLGGMLLGDRQYTNPGVLALARNGLLPAPDSSVVSRYPAYSTVNAAIIGGISRVRYDTVSNFDALHAEQDVATGVQLGLLAGPSIAATRGAKDILFATDLYAALGNSRSLVQARLFAESRTNRRADRLEDAVTAAQLSWYHRVSDRWTSHVALQGAELHGLDVPAQLTLRDPEGGVLGYASSHAAGGKRVTARIEERLRLPRPAVRADFAVALFAEAGRLWAGDAPYGVTTPVRATAGIAFITAIPAGGRRTYRIDIGLPLNSDHGQRFEIRLSSSDLTRGLRREPRDVSRVRSSALPTSLLAW